MPDDDSVSRWLDGLKQGDTADVQRLWDRYFQSLVRVAGAAARPRPPRLRRGGRGVERLP